jgi:hypothetical protein
MNEINGIYDDNGNCIFQGDDTVYAKRGFDRKNRVIHMTFGGTFNTNPYWETIHYWDLETDDIKEYHNSKGVDLFNHERDKSNLVLASEGNLNGFLIYL